MTVEELRPLDRKFHAAIAAAAGNPLLGELHIKVLDAVFCSNRYDGLLSGPDLDDVDQVLAESRSIHTVIAQAIADRDRRRRRCRSEAPRRRGAPPQSLKCGELVVVLGVRVQRRTASRAVAAAMM